MGDSSAAWTDVVGFESPYLDLSATLTEGIIGGNTYRFRVRAQNIHGFGPFSRIVFTTVPDTPDFS